MDSTACLHFLNTTISPVHRFSMQVELCPSLVPLQGMTSSLVDHPPSVGCYKWYGHSPQVATCYCNIKQAMGNSYHSSTKMEFFPTLPCLFHLATTIPATGRRNVAVFFAGALWHLAEEASRKTDIGNAVLGPVAGPYVSQRHWHWVGGGWGGENWLVCLIFF